MDSSAYPISNGMKQTEDERYTKVKYSTLMLSRDLWNMVAPYRVRFIIATFLRLTSDLVWLYPAYALAEVVNMLSRQERGIQYRLYTIFALWIVATIWRITGQQLAKLFCYQIAERVALDAHLATVRHMFSLDLAWHERENTGNKLKRIQKGADGLDKIIRMWIDNFIEIAVNLVGMVFIIGTIDTIIATILAIFLVTFFAISFTLARRTAVAQNIVNIKEEELSGLTFEVINNIRSVKVLAMGEALFELFRRQVADLFEKLKLRIFRYRAREWTVGMWSNVFRLGTIIYIVYGVMNGRYEVGFIVLFYGYFNKVWESINELSSKAQEFIIAKYGIGRMQAILQEPLKIESERGKSVVPKHWKTIRLENVSFAYGNRMALQNVSFEIRRGEKIGIVGLSGAGKSTLFKLLLKENEEYSGEIYFDDVPLRKIKRASYLEKVAVVLQDTEVFNFSLRDNITIADFHYARDEERLKTAIEVSNVDDFLPRLPKGLDTFIGEKGIRLSGGEKQRLGIARAIFKKPQILFLDEATSHLDLESEARIQDSLHHFFKTVTALVIAHRLTTIRQMDRIIVIQDGGIVEQGSFEELSAKRGRFHELWEKQRL